MRSITLLLVISVVSLQASFAANPASDSAADTVYDSNSWLNGTNGGTGFLPWTLIASSNDVSRNGFYVGSATNNGFSCNSPGGIDVNNRSWAMYASNPSNGATRVSAVAYRGFTGGSLGVGQTLGISMDNGWVESAQNGVIGFILRNGNDTSAKNNGQRLEFFFYGGGSDYLIVSNAFSAGTDTGIAYTEGGVKVRITLTSADTYLASITNLVAGTSTNITGTLGGTAGAGIDSIALYNEQAGEFCPHDLYFNALSIGDFGVKAAQLLNGTNAVVAFGTSANGVYTVETNSNLAVSGGWTPLLSNVAGNGGTIVTTNAVPAGIGHLFYRVRMTLP